MCTRHRSTAGTAKHHCCRGENWNVAGKQGNDKGFLFLSRQTVLKGFKWFTRVSYGLINAN